MSVGGLLLVALGIAIGMVGIVVPMVPGTGLVVLSIGAWALVESTTRTWVVLGCGGVGRYNHRGEVCVAGCADA